MVIAAEVVLCGDRATRGRCDGDRDFRILGKSRRTSSLESGDLGLGGAGVGVEQRGIFRSMLTSLSASDTELTSRSLPVLTSVRSLPSDLSVLRFSILRFSVPSSFTCGNNEFPNMLLIKGFESGDSKCPNFMLGDM